MGPRARFRKVNQSLAFLLFLTGWAHAADTWPNAGFAEVRAFAWPADKGTKEVVLPGMTLKPGALNEGGSVLSSQQIARLIGAVTGEHREVVSALCYEPHNAFVFYDGNHEPVAAVEICFGCLNSRINPPGAAEDLDFAELAAIFSELKLPLGEFADLAAFQKHLEETHPKKRDEP